MALTVNDKIKAGPTTRESLQVPEMAKEKKVTKNEFLAF
jgi:hypothetical protein